MCHERELDSIVGIGHSGLSYYKELFIWNINNKPLLEGKHSIGSAVAAIAIPTPHSCVPPHSSFSFSYHLLISLPPFKSSRTKLLAFTRKYPRAKLPKENGREKKKKKNMPLGFSWHGRQWERMEAKKSMEPQSVMGGMLSRERARRESVTVPWLFWIIPKDRQKLHWNETARIFVLIEY